MTPYQESVARYRAVTRVIGGLALGAVIVTCFHGYMTKDAARAAREQEWAQRIAAEKAQKTANDMAECALWAQMPVYVGYRNRDSSQAYHYRTMTSGRKTYRQTLYPAAGVWRGDYSVSTSCPA